jgi:hypothetical protein
MSRNGPEEDMWSPGRDPERSAGSAKKKRRYSVSPSSLVKTGIQDVSRNIHRVSKRVVNLAGSGMETQLRLGEGDEEPVRHEDEDEDLPDLSKVIPIRGYTLGFLGPDSRFRLALYRMLLYPCVLLLP